jgi:FkbH-like protein
MVATASGTATFHPGLGLAELTRLHRLFQKEGPIGERPKLKVAVLANYSTQFLTMGLQLALHARGVAPVLYESGYNQWEQELLDTTTGLANFQPDVVLLTLASELLAFREAGDEPAAFAARLANMVSAASRSLRCRFVVTLPPPLEEELEQTGWAYGWRERLCRELRTALDGLAVLVDLTPLMIQVGAAGWYSSRFYVTKKLPINPQTTARLADYLARTIVAIDRRPVRLVVLDLDNTLWPGTVGEVGWDGLDLDAEGNGFASLRLQRFLLGLHARGVLLAVCSKNNPEDALEVFRRRPEMLLKEHHFADMRINWESKSVNVRAILKTLNLTEPGTVFLDDSPFERGEVSCTFPEIWVPDLPEDPVDLVPFLVGSGRFTLPTVSAEDLLRQDQYRVERERSSLEATVGNLDEYYRSLSLVLTPKPIDDTTLQRSVDLLAKTNQFNLTTRRHGREAMRRFLDEPGNEVWCYGLRDRYGDYGVIAVLIGQREGDALRIDSWVMSCRAMGRTVERAIFNHLLERARHGGAGEVIGEFISTAKNKPIETLYDGLGFARRQESPGERLYVYETSAPPPSNDFVTISDDASRVDVATDRPANTLRP